MADLNLNISQSTPPPKPPPCLPFSGNEVKKVSAAPVVDVAASSSTTEVDDDFEDVCSICLEGFTSPDPATVTSCNHEYHLQCILEWAQRSKECPICWQLLVLKDASSQELLAAVEIERRFRSKRIISASVNIPRFHDNYDEEQDSYSDDSDFEDHIMRNLVLASSRAHNDHGRETRRSSEITPSELFVSPSSPNTLHNDSLLGEGQHAFVSSVENSPVHGKPSFLEFGTASSAIPILINVSPNAAISGTGVSIARVLLSEPATESPRGSNASESLSFSDSIKSKWACVSTRYKESFSKGKQGIKEKLTASNNSVKELSKGVRREMSAGIAGFARMIERLDCNPKRAGGSSSPENAGGTPLENAIRLRKNEEEVAHDRKLEASPALLP